MLVLRNADSESYIYCKVNLKAKYFLNLLVVTSAAAVFVVRRYKKMCKVLTVMLTGTEVIMVLTSSFLK